MTRLQIAYTPSHQRFYHWLNGSYNPNKLGQANGVWHIETYASRLEAIKAAITILTYNENINVCKEDKNKGLSFLNNQHPNTEDNIEFVGKDITLIISYHGS